MAQRFTAGSRANGYSQIAPKKRLKRQVRRTPNVATSPEMVVRPELVIGLVAPAGVRLDDLTRETKSRLDHFGYRSEDVRVSQLLANYVDASKAKPQNEAERISILQDDGDKFRAALKDGAALARAAIVAIREKRTALSKSPDEGASHTAYVVNQLKHPAEVDLLRDVYGSSFVLLAAHAPRKARLEELQRRIASSVSMRGQEDRFAGDASDIVNTDDKEEDDFGQNTRDAYPKADFFANLSFHGQERTVDRFVDLLFGHPLHTPTPEEYAMYLASAASLRSSDSSRQVGAVIVRLAHRVDGYVSNADVIAVGMNEVPRGSGGFYWDGDSPDSRDQALVLRGDDRPQAIKISVLTELIDRMQKQGLLNPAAAGRAAPDLARDLLQHLKRTQFMDISEFGRPVHGEMAALIDAARRGVQVDGHTMYVSTFPCHNCAKHVIAAGIRKVVYLEPYPKSRAYLLHREEIELESADGKLQDGKVVFSPFAGVAPRQYRPLFSMTLRGSKRGMPLNEWDARRNTLAPIHVKRDAFRGYVAAERDALRLLPAAVYKWDEAKVCPTGDAVVPQQGRDPA
jgi:deoxycytidylate deaminase